MYQKLVLSLALALMSGNAFAEEIQTSGICGETAEDCSWRYEDGKLTITGNGEMNSVAADYLSDRPWNHLKNDVTEIEMSGITTVGDRAFYAFKGLTNVTIPASVKILGTNAFANASNLEKVDFEKGSELTHLNWGVFAHANKIKTLEIPETVYRMSASVAQGGMDSLVLPKGVFEKGGYIHKSAIHSNMTIYCPKEYQEQCEDYVKNIAAENTDAKDSEGNSIYAPVTNMTLQTYEKDGDEYFINGSWYKHPNDVLTGKRIKKLRYTVEEAMKATEKGEKFHVFLTYK